MNNNSTSGLQRCVEKNAHCQKHYENFWSDPSKGPEHNQRFARQSEDFGRACSCVQLQPFSKDSLCREILYVNSLPAAIILTPLKLRHYTKNPCMWINGRYVIKAHRVTPIKHGFTNHDAHGFRVGALQVACFRCIHAVREWVSLDWRPKHIYNAPIYFHEPAVLKIIMDLKQILQAIKNFFSIPGQVECAQRQKFCILEAIRNVKSDISIVSVTQ